jgi:nanoRNase/pAp phosphatase (c-di-AMP/oligoRNAs hydrolase)
MSQKYNYIIYHNKCLDGFSGLFVIMLSNQISSDVFIYSSDPYIKTLPPNIEGKNIIIVDVAYNPSLIKEISEKANKLLFIDHHISIRDEIQNLSLQPPHKVIYDQTKSGATLAWDYFHKYKKTPWFLKYIEDNDLGKWQYENTLAFKAGLEVLYKLDHSKQNLQKWKQLLKNSEVINLIKIGKKYEEYKNFLLQKNSKFYSLEKFPSTKIATIYKDSNELKTPGKYTVAVVNGGCPDASLLGHKIAEDVKCDFVLIWSLNLSNKKYICQLRSNKTKVDSIAAVFGGGGHELASAFSFSSERYNITDLFYPNSLPRHRK